MNRYKEIDRMVENLIRRVEAGERLYIHGVRIRHVYKLPTAYRYRVVVELEDGRRLELHPSRFLHYLQNKAEVLAR